MRSRGSHGPCSQGSALETGSVALQVAKIITSMNYKLSRIKYKSNFKC